MRGGKNSFKNGLQKLSSIFSPSRCPEEKLHFKKEKSGKLCSCLKRQKSRQPGLEVRGLQQKTPYHMLKFSSIKNTKRKRKTS